MADGPTVFEATAAYLAADPARKRFALGGPAATADPQATPILGTDRDDTSRRVAERFFSAPAAVGLASGTAFPDAPSGGAQVAREPGPLLVAGTLRRRTSHS